MNSWAGATCAGIKIQDGGGQDFLIQNTEYHVGSNKRTFLYPFSLTGLGRQSHKKLVILFFMIFGKFNASQHPLLKYKMIPSYAVHVMSVFVA